MAAESEQEVDRLREALAVAEQRLEQVEAEKKSTTTLTGDQFLVLIMGGPVVIAFVILGIIIIYKVTSNPAEVAPHLDIILVALAIMAVPASGILTAVVGKIANGKRNDD